uniref:Ig-like domain-containing protein n=1 Tax=Cyanistes caeruleus TaxID=156563 RepID=A0A8C0VSV6_CYACU
IGTSFKSMINANCTFFFCTVESPYFSKEFQSMEVLKDSDVVLECEVLGTPPFEVFWVKDDKPVRSSKKHRISIEKSLITRTSDSGNYTCQISNDVGTATCKATLFVKGVQPNLIFFGSDFSVQFWWEGEEAF